MTAAFRCGSRAPIGVTEAPGVGSRRRREVGRRTELEHGGAGPSQRADWLLLFATGDEGEVGVAVETPRGPVVESLLERGLCRLLDHPKQLSEPGCWRRCLPSVAM